jgi:hypothetical protein
MNGVILLESFYTQAWSIHAAVTSLACGIHKVYYLLVRPTIIVNLGVRPSRCETGSGAAPGGPAVRVRSPSFQWEAKIMTSTIRYMEQTRGDNQHVGRPISCPFSHLFIHSTGFIPLKKVRIRNVKFS